MSSTESLRVALVSGEMYSPLYERLNDFTGQTGLSVEVAAEEQLPELMAHLQVALSGGLDYHLVSGHSQYVPGLAPALLPLDDLLPSEDLAPFLPLALDLCRWEDRLYALPRSIETRLLFYRSDIFE